MRALEKVEKRNDQVPIGVMRRSWGISGIFVPGGVVQQLAAPAVRTDLVLPQARSKISNVAKNQYLGIVASATGGTYLVEDSIVGYVYAAADLADYRLDWSSNWAVAFPGTPTKQLRNPEEERENVVEFRTLPTRIESLAFLRGKVRFSGASSVLTSESRRHSPNIEEAFEEAPE